MCLYLLILVGYVAKLGPARRRRSFFEALWQRHRLGLHTRSHQVSIRPNANINHHRDPPHTPPTGLFLYSPIFYSRLSRKRRAGGGGRRRGKVAERMASSSTSSWASSPRKGKKAPAPLWCAHAFMPPVQRAVLIGCDLKGQGRAGAWAARGSHWCCWIQKAKQGREKTNHCGGLPLKQATTCPNNRKTLCEAWRVGVRGARSQRSPTTPPCTAFTPPTTSCCPCVTSCLL
jgi:hypothetical protein